MNLSSKLSMYDFFAILLPGFFISLLLACLSRGYFHSSQNISDGIYTLIVIVVLSYLVGIAYHKLIEYICKKLGFRNNKEGIKKQLEVFNAWLSQSRLKADTEDNTDIMIKYYGAYYFLMEKNCLNSIPVLEAQFVFLRNMIPLLCIYAIMICFCQTWSCYAKTLAGCPCVLIVFLLLLVGVLIYLANRIQKKIYYLVWEGYYFLSKQEKND